MTKNLVIPLHRSINGHRCPASFAAEGAAHTGGLEGYKVGVQAEGLDKLEHVKQVLVPPPAVPEHSLEHPAKPRVVQVEMTIHEKKSKSSRACSCGHLRSMAMYRVR